MESIKENDFDFIPGGKGIRKRNFGHCDIFLRSLSTISWTLIVSLLVKTHTFS